jgi:hypothetical protein
MAKNILRRQFGNMYGKDKPFEIPTKIIRPIPPIEPPVFSITYAILLLLFILLVSLLYFYRDHVYSFFEKIKASINPVAGIDQAEKVLQDLMKPKPTESEPKKDPETEKEREKIEVQENKKKETETSDNSGGVKKLDQKLNRYSEEQRVKSDGFCYIGYDQQRECTNVYEGDICMSGQIFPTMEVCMNTHLRP